MEGNPAVAKMLIQHGADANKKDKEGKTVLMVSVQDTISVMDNNSTPFLPLDTASGTEWT